MRTLDIRNPETWPVRDTPALLEAIREDQGEDTKRQIDVALEAKVAPATISKLSRGLPVREETLREIATNLDHPVCLWLLAGGRVPTDQDWNDDEARFGVRLNEEDRLLLAARDFGDSLRAATGQEGATWMGTALGRQASGLDVIVKLDEDFGPFFAGDLVALSADRGSPRQGDILVVSCDGPRKHTMAVVTRAKGERLELLDLQTGEEWAILESDGLVWGKVTYRVTPIEVEPLRVKYFALPEREPVLV